MLILENLMKFLITNVALAFFVACACCNDRVLAAHADIEVDVAGGQIVVEDGPVFEGDLGSDFNLDGTSWRGDDPGFDAEGTLTSGEVLGFDVTGPLLHWNGSGWSSSTITALHQLTFGTPLSSTTLTIDGSTASAGGFTIDTADVDGDLHQHLTFDLNRSDSGVVTRGDAYAIQIALTSSLNTTSDPFFIALNNGMDEAGFEAAATALVPEPATLGVFVVGGVALMLRRRAGRVS